MSADNTVFILVTRAKDGSGDLEYRVAFVDFSDALFGKNYPDQDRGVFDRAGLLNHFHAEPIYKAEEALKAAAYWLNDPLYLAAGIQIGIRVLYYPEMSFPAKKQKRKKIALRQVA